VAVGFSRDRWYNYIADRSHPPVASAVVEKPEYDPDHVYAWKPANNYKGWKLIARGEAGVKDAKVIQSAIDLIGATGGGRIFIAKGEYIIHPTKRGEYWYIGLIMKNNVAIEGEGMGKTILKFTDINASGRVDGISFDSGDLYNIEIKNMTLDGSLIDWENKIGYGEGIRAVDPTNTVNNALLENLYLKGWRVGWGIGWGYTKKVGKILVARTIIGENVGRGVIWIANQDQCDLQNIRGNVIGYEPSQEGHILCIESGVYHSINGVFGSAAEALVALGGTIRTNVSNVQGVGKYGIFLAEVTHVNVNNLKFNGDPTKSIGVYWRNAQYGISISNANIEHCKYGIYIEGKSDNYIVDFAFDGRIGSWDENQSTAIYLRYVDTVNIQLSRLTWGYGTLFDIDYAKNVTINIANTVGVNTTNIGTNIEKLTIISKGVYTTRNSGTAKVTGNGTDTTFTVDISHGLVKDKAVARITLDREGTVDKVYLVDKDGDGFKETLRVVVTYATAPADGEEVPIYWEAEVV